jgi:hypothetical protein
MQIEWIFIVVSSLVGFAAGTIADLTTISNTAAVMPSATRECPFVLA